MPIEDLLLNNLGVVSGFIGGTVQRWTKAAMDARNPGYSFNSLFGTLREQFIDNWDTWSTVLNFSGYPLTPTLTIQSQFSSLSGKNKAVYTRQRLTNAAFQSTDLEQFGGANTIPAANVQTIIPASAMGGDFDFDGKAIITLLANAPAAGTYRGLILVKTPQMASFEPLTWVVVIADP
jgi:hypothetical protein